jgi:Domain of unknown function (DU1801)
MQSKAVTVEQYLAGLDEERRHIVEVVRSAILDNLDAEFEEGIQYGMIGYYVPHAVHPAGYHANPAQPLPFAALAAQKNYVSLYLMGIYGDEASRRDFERRYVAAGKKLEMGKSCIRFARLDQIPLDVVGETIRGFTARGYAARATAHLREHGSAKTAKPGAAKGKPEKAAPSKAAKAPSKVGKAPSKVGKAPSKAAKAPSKVGKAPSKAAKGSKVIPKRATARVR